MDILRCLYIKELRNLYRDKEVIVFGLVVPLLLFPIIAIVVMETSFACAGVLENNKIRVAIVAEPADREYLKKGLSKPRSVFKVVDDSNPSEHLRSGQLDATITVKEHNLELRTVEETDPMGMVRNALETALISVCVVSRYDAMTAAKLPVTRATPFRIRRIEIGAPAKQLPPKHPVQDPARTIVAGVFVVILLQAISLSASFATGFPIIAEIEQKTILPTLMLATNSLTVWFSKYLAALTVILLSAFNVTFGAAMAVFSIWLFVFFGPPQLSTQNSATTNSATQEMLRTVIPSTGTSHALTTMQWIALVAQDLALALLATSLCCAMLFAAASWARTSSEAQSAMAFPGLAATILPPLALLPAAASNNIVLSVPLVNIFALMQQTQFSLWCPIIIAENLALTIFLIVAGNKVFLTRNLLGTGGIRRRDLVKFAAKSEGSA